MLQSLIFYVLVVLIWGSSWSGITFQLGVVPPEQSLAYRFALASLLLFLYGKLSGASFSLDRQGHLGAMLQGFFLFGLNYLLIYYGAASVTSGLVAVLFSSIVIMNTFNERLFFAVAITWQSIVAGFLGLGGIAIIFWPEISASAISVSALLFVLGGTLTASFGNMAAIKNMKSNVSVLALNAWGMAYGCLCMTIIVSMWGRPWTFDPSLGYTASLIYLAVVATAIGFGLYLVLIRKIGATAAAFSSVLYPVVALLISTWLEGLRLTLFTAVGVVLILAGNTLMLLHKRT